MRLPTEKAHGLQIMQMCSGLSHAGAQVRLLVPERSVNPTAVRHGSDPFDYFGVERDFEVQALRNLDVLVLERLLGRLFPLAFTAHEVAWGLYSTSVARKASPDIAYTRQETLLYLLVHAGIPTIYEAHGVPQGLRRRVLKSALRHEAFLGGVAVTRSIARRLRELGATAREVRVEPDAVNLDLFSGLPTKTEARESLDLPSDLKIVGYVGGFRTMAEEKGIGSLIQAVGRLREERACDVVLVCVGGEEDAARGYRALARQRGIEDGAVRFVGRVPHHQVPVWLRTFDVACMPMPATAHFSYNMSPMKMFEYMAAEVPIVATDLPATREILEDDVTACLVAPNVDGLAEGIAKVLGDPRYGGAVAERARTHVQQYTWKARSRRILDALVPGRQRP